MAEAYFDESGTDDPKGVMCIAGYVLLEDQARKLDQEWLETLQHYDLAYFHMSSCAHGTGIFKKLSKPQRVDVARSMIEIIKRRVERGIVATITEEEYLREVPESVRLFSKSAYSWCMKCALRGVNEWIQKFNIKEPFLYFFESGHQFQSEADAILTSTFALPDIRAQYNYVAHSFATKIPDRPDNPCVRPLQAADLLAWQARKWKADPKRRRADFRSLLEAPHFILDSSTQRLRQMASLDEEFTKLIRSNRPVTPESV